MAKSRKREAFTATLNQIRAEPSTAASLTAIRQVLASQNSLAIAQSARIVSDAEIHTLLSDLVAAFDRSIASAAL
jgi:hypothetical protein